MNDFKKVEWDRDGVVIFNMWVVIGGEWYYISLLPLRKKCQLQY